MKKKKKKKNMGTQSVMSEFVENQFTTYLDSVI